MTDRRTYRTTERWTEKDEPTNEWNYVAFLFLQYCRPKSCF